MRERRGGRRGTKQREGKRKCLDWRETRASFDWTTHLVERRYGIVRRERGVLTLDFARGIMKSPLGPVS